MTLGAELVALVKGTSHLTDPLLPTGGSQALCQVDGRGAPGFGPAHAAHWSAAADGRGNHGRRRGDWLRASRRKHCALCWERRESRLPLEAESRSAALGRRSARKCKIQLIYFDKRVLARVRLRMWVGCDAGGLCPRGTCVSESRHSTRNSTLKCCDSELATIL